MIWALLYVLGEVDIWFCHLFCRQCLPVLQPRASRLRWWSCPRVCLRIPSSPPPPSCCLLLSSWCPERASEEQSCMHINKSGMNAQRSLELRGIHIALIAKCNSVGFSSWFHDIKGRNNYLVAILMGKNSIVGMTLPVSVLMLPWLSSCGSPSWIEATSTGSDVHTLSLTFVCLLSGRANRVYLDNV